MKYQINQKVQINKGECKGEIGIVKSFYDLEEMDCPLYAIRLSDDSLVKVFEKHLEPVPVEESNGDTITIDRETFREAIRKVTESSRYESYFSDPTKATIVSLAGGVIGKSLEVELFGEVEND